MSKRGPSKKDVSALARWIHETHHRKNPGPIAPDWKAVPAVRRGYYLTLARELLTNPPAVLRDAVLRSGG
jgi:hypothetical protein